MTSSSHARLLSVRSNGMTGCHSVIRQPSSLLVSTMRWYERLIGAERAVYQVNAVYQVKKYFENLTSSQNRKIRPGRARIVEATVALTGPHANRIRVLVAEQHRDDGLNVVARLPGPFDSGHCPSPGTGKPRATCRT